METPPGELPAFLAYRLNGEPIPLERGGPVRMVVPWAHGFKSIKWLQRIVLTNDFRANDTYALANNDPESHLKSAAYLDSLADQQAAGQPVVVSGLAISGLSGLRRVEVWVRDNPGRAGRTARRRPGVAGGTVDRGPNRTPAGRLDQRVPRRCVVEAGPGLRSGRPVSPRSGRCATAWCRGLPRSTAWLPASTKCGPAPST